MNAKVCPNCGAQNNPASAFCVGCGTKFAAENNAAKVCPNCGAQNNPASAFCVGCGTKLDNAPSGAAPSFNNPQAPHGIVGTTFKAAMMKAWTLQADRIIVGSKEVMLSSITKFTHELPKGGMSVNGVIQVFYGKGAFDFATLAYPKKQAEEGAKAADYIFSHCPLSTQKASAEPQTSAPQTSVSSADEIKKYKELLDMGAITQEEFDAKKKQLLGL